MAADSPKRKLAAIMFTDMVGYTALMQKDEEKARALIEKQREILSPIVKKHDGSVLQYVGDGTFCSFDSAIESVTCATEILKALKSEKDISLRIGIHVGDVVIKGDEVYGDGVNVASRLEPIAAPGGVCISGRVFDDIKNHPDIKAEPLGEIKLKNVDVPMLVYALSGEGLTVSKLTKQFDLSEAEGEASSETQMTAENPKKNMIIKIAAAALAIPIIWMALRFFPGDGSVQEIVADENSIAVLFIENIADPEDSQHLAEMIKELIITDLSQSQALRVVGSQRLFDIAKKYGDGDKNLINRENASKVAREARARWMLTGKLSQFGSRMLLTTQIEGVSDGKLLNAQRAEGEDLFALADRLSEEIRNHLGVIGTADEINMPVNEMTTTSEEAYRLYVRGLKKLNRSLFQDAKDLLAQAVEIDSTFSKALLQLAHTNAWLEIPPYTNVKEVLKQLSRHMEGLTRAEERDAEAFKARIDQDWQSSNKINKEILRENRDDKNAHYGMGESYFHDPNGDFLLALDEFEEVLRLDPEFTLAYRHIFDIYRILEMDDEGIRVANRLIRKKPDESIGYSSLASLYRSKYFDGLSEPEPVLENYQKAIELAPNKMSLKMDLAFFKMLIGDFERSISDFELISNSANNTLEIIVSKMSIGRSLIGLRDYEKAYQLFGKIANSEKGAWKARALRLIGRLDVRLGKLSEGMRTFADALEIAETSGDSVVIMEDMANTLYYFGEYDKSNKIMEKILEHSRSEVDRARVHHRFGLNRSALKEFKEAERELDKIKSIVSRNETKFRNRYILNALTSRIYYDKGDYKAALDEYSGLKKNQNIRLKALIYLKLKEYDKALERAEYMQGPSIAPGYLYYPESFYIKGMIYEEMGNSSLARENYKALLDLWKDGDKDNPVLIDTQDRLNSLQTGS